MVSSASKKETFLKSNHGHGGERSIQPLERPLMIVSICVNCDEQFHFFANVAQQLEKRESVKPRNDFSCKASTEA